MDRSVLRLRAYFRARCVLFSGHIWCIARGFTRCCCRVLRCGFHFSAQCPVGASLGALCFVVGHSSKEQQASRQQDPARTARLERAWGNRARDLSDMGALVLVREVFLGGCWCEMRLAGLDFGVRCAVLGLILVRGGWPWGGTLGSHDKWVT